MRASNGFMALTVIFFLGTYATVYLAPANEDMSLAVFTLCLMCVVLGMICRAREYQQGRLRPPAEVIHDLPLHLHAAPCDDSEYTADLRRRVGELEDEIHYLQDELEHAELDNEELNLINLREIEYQDKAVEHAVKLETALLQDRIDELAQENDELRELLAGRKP